MKLPLAFLLLAACAGSNVDRARPPTLAEVTAGDELNLEGPEPAWAKAPGPFIVDGAVYAVGTATGIRHYQLGRSISYQRALTSLAKWGGSYVSQRRATDGELTVTERAGISLSRIQGQQWIAVWHDPTANRFVSLVRLDRPIISIFDGNPELISALFRGQANLIARIRERLECPN